MEFVSKYLALNITDEKRTHFCFFISLFVVCFLSNMTGQQKYEIIQSTYYFYTFLLFNGIIWINNIGLSGIYDGVNQKIDWHIFFKCKIWIKKITKQSKIVLTSFGAADMHHAFIHKDGITFDIILLITGGLRNLSVLYC